MGYVAEEPISSAALLRRAFAARREGRLDEARRDFAAAADLSRAAGEISEEARALAGLGQIARDLGDIEAALQLYQAALALCRSVGEALRIAHVVRHVADILRHLGRSDAAARAYAEALELYRNDAGTPPLDLANTLRGLAILQQDTGERAEAAALWNEAAGLYAAAGVAQGQAECQRRAALLTSTELI